MPRVEPLPSATPRNRTPVAARDPAGGPASFSLPEMLNEVAARRSARAPEKLPRKEGQSEPTPRDRTRERSDRFEQKRELRSEANVPRRTDRPDQVQSRRNIERAHDDRRTERSGADKADETRPRPEERGTEQVGQANGDTPSAAVSDAGREPESAEAGPESAGLGQPGSVPPAALGLQLAAGLVLATEAGAAPGSSRSAAVQGIGAGTARPSAKGGEPVSEGATTEDTAEPEGAAAAPTGKAVPGAVSALPGKQDGTADEHGPSSERGFAGLLGLSETSGREPAGPNARPSFMDLLGPAAATEQKAGAAAQRTVVTDVAVGRVPIEIGLRSLEGTNQFEIRLSPEELGRVDVKLDIDASGEVRAHLIVERPEALALLTRDRAQLERAFEQAGLRPGDGGIAFSLRDGTADNGGQSMRDGSRQGERGRAAPAPEAVGAQNAGAALPRAILSRLGALDLRI